MTLGTLCLMSKDVSGMAEFYRSVLQCESDGDNIHQEILVAGNGFAIYNNGDVKDMPNHNMSFAFDVDDVNIEYQRLKALNVTVLEPPTDRPWGLRNMMFADPDGNHVVFRSLITPL